MKTIFLGTAWESFETLKVLHKDSFFDVVCTVTTPDKLIGRKQISCASAVKKYSIKNNIPVVHTENKKVNYMRVLEKYKPDIVVCKAFGEIIPKEFLEYPKYGCINIHFSILPKFRGAVPIQKAILEGERETGISIMLMSEKLDEGDILEIFRERILPNDTNITLRERLVRKTTEILIPTLKKWVEGEIAPMPQDHTKATYCWQKDISKESAEILWDKYSPDYIERMVRALLPWPVAWTRLPDSLPSSIAGKRMKIFEAELVELENEEGAGILFSRDKKLFFSTKNPFVVLRIKSFQIEGKNKTDEKMFLNGIKFTL